MFHIIKNVLLLVQKSYLGGLVEVLAEGVVSVEEASAALVVGHLVVEVVVALGSST
jgi:hypothetical protein